jgi:hypothetical protein
LKIFLKLLKFFFLIIFLAGIFPYLICPFYKYPDIKPFSGKLFYNPYEKIDSSAWKKTNFHTHSRQWSGITAGSTSPADLVASKYKELKYDIVSISDYQDINTLLDSSNAYIPVYEHGYGILKNHQLVIGARGVSWKEYLLLQSFHNKQDILNSLRQDNEVISINHPKLRGAYSTEDLKYLRGYDLLEVVNHSYFDAADLWDSALSAGNNVFVVANDDNHDINDAEDYGYAYTMVNTPDLKLENVLSSLRYGRTFGVELEPQKDTSPQKKIEQSGLVPVIISCTINKDTLALKFSKKCDSLKLIGQSGVLKSFDLNSDSIIYNIKEEDTYIRPEINHGNMINVFLNPVFRFDGELKTKNAEIDLLKTWLFRLIFSIILTGIFWWYLRHKKNKSLGRSRN